MDGSDSEFTGNATVPSSFVPTSAAAAPPQSADLPPTEAIHQVDKPSYRPRDFRPGRRAAPSLDRAWSAPTPLVEPSTDLRYHTQAHFGPSARPASAPIAVVPPAVAAAPVAPASQSAPPIVAEVPQAMSRRELRERLASGLTVPIAEPVAPAQLDAPAPVAQNDVAAAHYTGGMPPVAAPFAVGPTPAPTFLPPALHSAPQPTMVPPPASTAPGVGADGPAGSIPVEVSSATGALGDLFGTLASSPAPTSPSLFGGPAPVTGPAVESSAASPAAASVPAADSPFGAEPPAVAPSVIASPFTLGAPFAQPPVAVPADAAVPFALAPLAPTPQSLAQSKTEYDVLTGQPLTQQAVVVPTPSTPAAQTPTATDQGRLAPVGHWSTQIDAEDHEILDGAINRTIGSGTNTTNALVLPSIPLGTDIRGPLTSTGEIMLTGSIDLPQTLSATGQSDRFDNAGMDNLFDLGDAEVTSTDSSPVRAIRAVSTHHSGHGVTHTQKPKGTGALTGLLIAASSMAVVVAGLLVAAFAFKVF